MREIVLDGSNWVRPGDFYEAFLHEVGAPAWHGHNFNALRDSIATGKVNAIEVPYLIKIKNYALIGEEAKQIVKAFVELIKKLRESGVPVDIEIEVC
jgi:RNAse (barnase) inhibitor barstar